MTFKPYPVEKITRKEFMAYELARVAHRIDTYHWEAFQKATGLSIRRIICIEDHHEALRGKFEIPELGVTLEEALEWLHLMWIRFGNDFPEDEVPPKILAAIKAYGL